MVDETLLLKSYEARNRFIASLGRVDPQPIAAPNDDGRPWPGLRRGWRVIHREAGATAIISDGLSDPFTDSPKPNAGLAIEVLAETSDPIDRPIEQSWLFELVHQLSQECVEHGGFRNLIDKLGLICLELENSAGVLLGVKTDGVPTSFDAPGGAVRIMTATLLTPAELAYAGEHRREGLAELEKRFVQRGWFHASSKRRESVV